MMAIVAIVVTVLVVKMTILFGLRLAIRATVTVSFNPLVTGVHTLDEAALQGMSKKASSQGGSEQACNGLGVCRLVHTMVAVAKGCCICLVKAVKWAVVNGEIFLPYPFLFLKNDFCDRVCRFLPIFARIGSNQEYVQQFQQNAYQGDQAYPQQQQYPQEQKHFPPLQYLQGGQSQLF
uniref:Uncharacterized protein n=1 Tax=Romanomermis culicivorax TaxID=13658 RepID=A0A915J3J9_ROMCU